MTDWSQQAKASVTIKAPAKVNLTLHVTGQRPDGYHLLDSLVVFADVGDDLYLQVGNTLSVTTEGPEAAGVPADLDNLVLKVARLFDDQPGASFLLTKNLPVASGIGGGSADAAAAFRGLICHWSGLMPGDDIPPVLFDPAHTPKSADLAALGADIPVCLLSRATRMRGIGELLAPVPDLPPVWAVLVNPRVAVSTPDVFGALGHKDNAPMPRSLPRFAGAHDLADWLHEQRNDLQAPAIACAPMIARVLTELDRNENCLLARMSGSGATCFGLFATQEDADAAAVRISGNNPDWWVQAARLGTMTEWATPVIG